MKNYLISGVIAVVVVTIGIMFFSPTPNVVNQSLGAVSSPIIQSPYFGYGGNVFWGAHTDALTQATTTICALQSPVATSTLKDANITLTISTTTAYGVNFARGATPYATTTALGAIVNAGANAQLTAYASTSPTTSDIIFPPSTYLVVSMAGGTGSFSPTGRCQAVWMQN